MLIHIEAQRRTAEVLEVEDLKRFSLVVDGSLSDEELEAALAPLGRLGGGDQAWISIDLLRAASDREGNQSWQAGFAAMIAYADSKGWVDEDGRSVRAHIERGPRA